MRIHVLVNGKPLCDFQAPAEGERWPKGEAWVHPQQAAELATCETCKAKAATLQAGV